MVQGGICRREVRLPRPERAKVQTEALRFAKCMQTHGMVNWPDPTSNGGYMVAPVGAAAESPTYLKAAKICRPLLPSG